MMVLSGAQGSHLTIPNWNLHFAREPEPDLEFTEEELNPPPSRGTSPGLPPKRSGSSPLLWVLLVLVIGGAAYLAMEPEMLMDLLGPVLGNPTKAPPPQVSRPAPPPTPATPGEGNTPESQPLSSPPPIQAPTSASPPGLPSSVPTIVPGPLFAEGQRVTVTFDPAVPGDTVSLSIDPAGNRPGPKVRPGSTLIVLDGEMQNAVWMYSVRSEDGSKGWVAEKRLRLIR